MVPNYAIVPKVPPVGEYRTAIENICNQLQQGKPEELRGEIKTVLKKIQAAKVQYIQRREKANRRVEKG